LSYRFPRVSEKFESLVDLASEMDVAYMLCVAVNLEDYPQILALSESHRNIYPSVGVHPNTVGAEDPSVERLVELGSDARVVAIGETGLDYFRSSGELDWQRDRFSRHIEAACTVNKPIIVHSRDAPDDTLSILREGNADRPGGVMHCFTGDYAMAKAAMELGFYISFSGIVTFKNATDLADVAKKIPMDRMLIETDSPYLAPVPKRGKENQPAYVRYTAEFLAQLKGIELAEFARATTDNFLELFNIDPI
jgi:TatD DNase family protein